MSDNRIFLFARKPRFRTFLRILDAEFLEDKAVTTLKKEYLDKNYEVITLNKSGAKELITNLEHFIKVCETASKHPDNRIFKSLTDINNLEVITCKVFNVYDPIALKTKSRHENVAMARYLIMYMLRLDNFASDTFIASMYYRKHSSVNAGKKTIDNLISTKSVKYLSKIKTIAERYNFSSKLGIY